MERQVKIRFTLTNGDVRTFKDNKPPAKYWRQIVSVEVTETLTRDQVAERYPEILARLETKGK